MALSSFAALWFLPFVLPVCFYVSWTDLAYMKITNKAVTVLAVIFVILGPFVLDGFTDYLWQLAQLVIVLLAGIALNAVGAFGAGDAKFAAAAAPYVVLQDITVVAVIFAVMMVAAFVAHRLVRASRLRDLAPGWKSWDAGNKFPMGLALGPTLALYLCLAALNGA